MNCFYCNSTLANDAKKCFQCGKPTNIAATMPAALGGTVADSPTVDVVYYGVPPVRLAVLSFVTFGLYDIYWFYKNWVAVQAVEKKKISPVGRAWFMVFFCNALFKKIFDTAKKHGFVEKYSPQLLAGVYIALLIASGVLTNIDNPTFEINVAWFVVSSITFLPLVAVQNAVNFSNAKLQPGTEVFKPISSAEIIIIVIGSILTLLGLVGTFLP